MRRKQPYIEPAWCVQLVAAPLCREKQADGRWRSWGEVILPGETAPRYLRVVTLADGGRRGAAPVQREGCSIMEILNGGPEHRLFQIAEDVRSVYGARKEAMGSRTLDLTRRAGTQASRT